MADSAADKRAVKKLQAVMLLGGTGLIAAGGGILALFGESLWACLGMAPMLVGVLWIATVFFGHLLRKQGVDLQLCCLRQGLWFAIGDALKFTGAWGLLVLAFWALQWLAAIERAN